MRSSLSSFVLTVSIVVLGACAPSKQSPPARVKTPLDSPAAETAPGPRAPLVLAVVVDQLAAWVAAERLPRLPDARGGFARLRREGVWVEDLTYLHAATETAPGHSSLFTGRPPSESGIVGNAVWRDDLGREASLLEDAGTNLVGPSGRIDRPGISLRKLRVDTLADALLRRDPQAVVVALSIKDRGAVFGGGRTPTAAVWFDDHASALVTSSAFSTSLPSWASRYAHPIGDRAALRWNLLDPAFVEAHATTKDDAPGEGTSLGGRTFPHVLSPGIAAASAFRASPAADRLVADLALAAVDGARRPGHPFLLALSFSANDYIGHEFGPDSWEAWDELMELDTTLGHLFDALDARVGKDGYSVILSGDHGIVSLPETIAAEPPSWCTHQQKDPYERPCAPGTRLAPDRIANTLDARIREAFGAGASMIARMIDHSVYLTEAARALPPNEKSRLDRVVREAGRSIPGVADVVPMSEIPARCPPPADESMRALLCRAVVAGVGDYYVVPQPGSFFWGSPGASSGVSHGSPYRYDRTVPLFVRYAYGGAAGRVVDRATFGSYYASAWYALTGEAVDGPYGGVVGRASTP